ncbi:general transcription repressor [Boothiomyces macroporosus]|uniref:General transcription repressor n=1 Tax=Boothiomyces macroporosus TaxID=261099 RepID=A0AAD5UCE4_9FUNG|nr:general transcription repressor [Boothiomyces macroporosus]
MSSNNAYNQRHPQQAPPHGNLPPTHSPKHQIHHQSPRIMELLEALRHEVDILHEESTFSKHHRKDLESKLASQITEMQAIQQSIYDLDRMHQKVKMQYEEEIMRLRRELESRGIPIPPPVVQDVRAYRKQSVVPDGIPPNIPPTQRQPAIGAFGNLPPQQGSYPPPHYQDKQDPAHMQKRQKIQDPPSGQRDMAPSPHHPNMRHRDSIPNVALKPVQQQPPQKRPEEYRQQPPHDFRPSQYNTPQRMPPSTQQQIPQQQPPPSYAPPSNGEPVKQSDDLTLVIHPKLSKANVGVDLLHSLDHSSVVCYVKFSPDGKYLATGCKHYAQIFDVASGRKLVALIDEAMPQEDMYIRSVCFSPDGVYLATGGEDRIIRIWDIAKGTVKMKLSGHEQDIYSLDWSKENKIIVSGSGDHTVKVWDAENGKLLKTLSNDDDTSAEKNGKEAGVTSVAIRQNDCKCIITGSLDDYVRVWDLRTGNLLERFESHEKSVYSVAFSPDGLSFISGSLDQTLKIWDLDPRTLAILNAPPGGKVETLVTKKCRQSFKGHQDFVLSVCYPGTQSSIGRVDNTGKPIQDPSFNIDWIVSGGKDRHVLFLDAKDMKAGDLNISPLISMSGHKNSVISVACGLYGGIIATGSGDNKARIWRISRAVQSWPAVKEQPPASSPKPTQPIHQPPQQRHEQPPQRHEQPPQRHEQPPLQPAQPVQQQPPPAQSPQLSKQPVLSLPVMKPRPAEAPAKSPSESKEKPSDSMETD